MMNNEAYPVDRTNRYEISSRLYASSFVALQIWQRFSEAEFIADGKAYKV